MIHVSLVWNTPSGVHAFVKFFNTTLSQLLFPQNKLKVIKLKVNTLLLSVYHFLYFEFAVLWLYGALFFHVKKILVM